MTHGNNRRARYGARVRRHFGVPCAGFGGDQSLAPVGRVEVTRELGYGGRVQRGIPMEVAACGEHEQRSANGGVSLQLVQRDRPAGHEREDDQLDVVSRSDTRLRSSRA